MKQIAFVLDQFELQSPGQQLLDRFLIGYHRNGTFQPATAKAILTMPRAGENSLVQTRVKEFGLEISDSAALSNSDIVMIAPGGKTFDKLVAFSPALLEQTVNSLRPGATFFVEGSLLASSQSLLKLQQLTSLRSVNLLSSTAASHLIPLPIKPVFAPDRVRKALIVVQGPFPQAEVNALFALKPYLGSDWVKAGAPEIIRYQNAAVWDFAYSSAWRPLLAAAISRSNTIKGGPEKDGRTQDIVGLQLLENLAPQPRAWLLRQNERQIAILVLDGALGDMNFAVEASNGIHSAQLYSPPAPLQDHYSAFAAWITDRTTPGDSPGDFSTALFISTALETMPRR